MTKRPFRLKPGHKYTACPECGNRSDFIACADQCAEDFCEVWVECRRCGHDPTRDRPDHRLEDVWGSLDPATIAYALQCREDALAEVAAGADAAP